jgi:integrase
MYPQYLSKNNSNTSFFFRSYIPKDLLHLYDGRKMFRISLKCVNKVISKKICLYLYQQTQILYEQIRMGKSLTINDIKEILRIEVRKQIKHTQHFYLGTNVFDKEQTKQSLDVVSTRETKMKEDLSGENIKGYERELDKKLEGILSSLDIEIETNSINYKNLRRQFIQIYQLRFDWIRTIIKETGKFDEDSFRREVDEKLKVSLFPDLQSILPPPIIENYNIPEPREPYLVTSNSVEVKYNKVEKSKLIREVVDEFLVLRKGVVGEKLLNEYKVLTDEFIEIIGNIPVSLLSKDSIRKYIKTLIKLPNNRRKNPRYRDLSIDEVMKLKDVTPQSRINVNKCLTRLTTFMKFGVSQGYIKENYIDGMKIPISKKDERKKREPFSPEDLVKILNPKTYLNYTIDYKKISSNQHTTFTTNKNVKLSNPYYWSFLIGIFSGMRTNEISQLRIDDIVKEGNVWMIIIDETQGKRVKTTSSIRKVPVHPKLIKSLGFLDYVEIIKSKGFDRIFPELTKDRDGYSSKISRHYNQNFLPSIGVWKKQVKVLYSTRHTFINRCYNKGVDRDIIKEIVGHEPDFTMDTYGGNPFTPTQLYQGISKVSYSDIRWNRLEVDWKNVIG